MPGKWGAGGAHRRLGLSHTSLPGGSKVILTLHPQPTSKKPSRSASRLTDRRGAESLAARQAGVEAWLGGLGPRGTKREGGPRRARQDDQRYASPGLHAHPGSLRAHDMFNHMDERNAGSSRQ